MIHPLYQLYFLRSKLWHFRSSSVDPEAIPASDAPIFSTPDSVFSALGATPFLVSALAPINNLLRQFMQAYKENYHQLDLAPSPAKSREDALDKSFKARDFDLSYGNSYMKCYYFCPQYKDHLETAKGKGHKRILFAATFLRDRIFNCWHQYKTRSKRKRTTFLSWV